MDTIRVLRRDIRLCVVSYFANHQDDYDAFMAASSVLFLLQGQPGLSVEDRAARVDKAHDSLMMLVARLMDESEPTDDSELLFRAHDGLHQIMELMQPEHDRAKRDTEILARYEQEFADGKE